MDDIGDTSGKEFITPETDIKREEYAHQVSLLCSRFSLDLVMVSEILW
jgi:hypothetical protein